MFRKMMIVAAALGLAACTTTPAGGPVSPGTTAPSDTTPGGPPYTLPTPETASPISTVDKAAEAVARADVALDRAWTAYSAIKRVADLVVPYLSPTRAANVRSIQATVETAFGRARATADLAVKAAELAKAAQAAATLEALTTDPD